MVSETARGLVIDRTYELLSPLGKGGMGEVWRARHCRLPRDVAVKILSPLAAQRPELAKRFRREAEIASQLIHPHIVNVIDFSTLSDGRPYLVMELLEGENLRRRLIRGGLGIEEAQRLLRQIASGLHAAHQRGVVHRDLKPENIFLCQRSGDFGATDVNVKVLDFGISKIEGSETLATSDNRMLGTPRYMAPEQLHGPAVNVDARADQFALGTIAYEMFSGRPLIGGESTAEVVFQVVYQDPDDLGSLNPGLPPRAIEAVHRALRKDPNERYRDVLEFHAALSGETLSALSAELVVKGARVSETPLVADPTANTVAAKGGGDMAERGVHEGASDGVPPGPSTSALAPRRGAPAGPHEAPGALLQTLAEQAPPAQQDTAVGQPQGPKLTSAQARWIGAIVLAWALLMFALLWPHSPGREPSEVASKGTVASLRAGAADLSQTERAADASSAASSPHTGGDLGSAHTRKPDASGLRGSDARRLGARRGDARPRPRIPGGKSGRHLRQPSSPAQAALLNDARQALARGAFEQALHLGRKALREGRSPQAYGIMARAYCGKRDLGMARAMLRNVSRRGQARIKTACKHLGFPIVD